MPRSSETVSSIVAVLPIFGLLLTTPPVQATEVAKIGAKIDRPIQPVNLVADGPDIQLLAPENGGTYTSPIGIEIEFDPEDGTTVDLETLKVTVVSTTAVGVFEIDITEDIIDYASQDGISAPNAEIPAGEHVVTIRVADSERRAAERQLSITVRDESVLERRAQD